MTSRKWVINGADRTVAAALQADVGYLPLTARLLCSRGMDTKEKVAEFYNTANLSFYDPYLLKDMDKAVARIKKAIENKC